MGIDTQAQISQAAESLPGKFFEGNKKWSHKGDHLVVELSADFFGLLARTTKSKYVMVAGARFGQQLTVKVSLVTAQNSANKPLIS